MPATLFPLTNPWRLTHFPQESVPAQKILEDDPSLDWIAAEVPGNVLLDLRRAGLISDPFVGMNPEEVRPLEYHEWWYHTTIALPEDAPAEGSVNLLFEGIDTFAEIYLDGELLGTSENMLISHRLPLPPGLQASEWHDLHVRIKSDQYEVSQRDFDGVVDSVQNEPSRAWIRKGSYSHGWDIFPRLLSAGIWKDVSLEYEPSHHLQDVFVFTKQFSRDSCTIMARVTVGCPRVYRTDLSVRFRLLDGEREVYTETYPMRFPLVVFRFPLPDPKLWWPRPYGEPHLYGVEAELIDNDRVIDRWTGHFGVRSIEISQEPLPEGRRTFRFKINDVPVTAFGHNHVPLDSFPSLMAGRLQRSIDLLDESRCNMVRVWGGGIYESDSYYDACDRLGIMVWQDFMFSCALNPQCDEFLDLVRTEARQIIKRLRNHPSIVLYCGDNEIDTHLTHFFSPHQKGGNRAISHSLLPEYVLRYDGTRPYWDSSPFTPLPGEPAHSHKAGDTHIWCHGVYYKHPVYSDDRSPFISEIGHLAIPNRESVERFIPPEYLWPRERYVWGYRCGILNDPVVHGFPDGRLKSIDKNIANVFGAIPDNLDDVILASQIVQAEAYKTWIERARRRKNDCGGILWWNLQDGCPQCSDAVVDYYFGKKLAFDFIRRVQDDVLLCIQEVDGELRLFAVSDRLQQCTADFWVMTGETILTEGRADLPANQVVDLGPVAPASEAPRLYLLQAIIDGKSYCNHYLDGVPPFSLETLKGFLATIEEFVQRRVEKPLCPQKLAR